MGKSKAGAAKKRRPYFQLTRRGAYGSLLLIVAACAWMFFVGVLVGRGTAPIHFDMQALNRELEALKRSSEERRRQQLEAYAAAMEDASTLDVYAELKRSDDELTIDPALSRRVPTPRARTEAPDAAGPAAQTAIRVIRRREGMQAKTAGRPKLKIRPTVKKSATPANRSSDTRAASDRNGRLTVQVAAIKNARAATQMVTRLRRDGFDAYQSKKTLPGQGTWYRVRVGRYRDRQSAAGDMRRLKGQGASPIIVAY